MGDRYSRRSFLTGVLACGTLSASAAYFLPGGRSTRSVRLRLATGADSTGARKLLIDMWNRVNPTVFVEPDEISSGTLDERSLMLSKAQTGAADIVNLDIIHIREFADKKLITPIALANALEFLPPTLVASRVAGDSGRYWAAPFNTDVGMLFSRVGDGRDEPGGLAAALAAAGTGKNQFAGQLKLASSTSYEAFVVNVLEHALAVDSQILGADGQPSRDRSAWQDALTPLRNAIQKSRVASLGTEADTLTRFVEGKLPYMRNWPVKYRELQQRNDPDVRTGRIKVGPLPLGILGGQSLAVVRDSPHAEQALAFIHYLTSLPAQIVVAEHGLAPTLIGAYSDPNLAVVIPHLDRIRGAVEDARLRPITPHYDDISKLIRDHVSAFLDKGTDIPSTFATQLGEALNR